MSSLRMAGQPVVRCSKPSVAMAELSIALNTGASMTLMRVGVAAAVLRANGPRSSALSTDERAASTYLCALNVSPPASSVTSAPSPLASSSPRWRCRSDGGTET
uniref:Uncharacterized protein n=1 Tax=Oryza meridionalis TaxID=40149 RepID=A0A0E0DJL8_9ORYZ